LQVVAPERSSDNQGGESSIFIGMGGPFNMPPINQVGVADFGPGQSNDVQVHHGGQMIVIAANGDGAFRVPQLIQPQPGTVDIVIHGKPGRFGTTPDADIEIPAPVVAQLLVNHGVAFSTPLRCITCHGGESPSVGPTAAERLAQAWNGSVLAPDGFCIVTVNTITIDRGDWEPDPIFGGQQFDPKQPGQGTFAQFTP
jgi:hypothetical protein